MLNVTTLPTQAQPVLMRIQRSASRAVRAFALLLLALPLLAASACSDGVEGGPRIRQVTQLKDTENDKAPYTVWATILPGSRAVTQARLYYARPQDPQFLVVDMTSLGENAWQGSIPPQAFGTTVRYFVWAADGAAMATYPQDQSPAVYLSFHVLWPGTLPPEQDTISVDADEPDVQVGTDATVDAEDVSVGEDAEDAIAVEDTQIEDSGPSLDTVDVAPDIGPKIDTDGDGIYDYADNCPTKYNPDQSDSDGDKLGDSCDSDADGDGAPNAQDNCVYIPNAGQSNIDGDIDGDACDIDIDGDGLWNTTDNCPYVPNSNQKDLDGNGVGDMCDPTTDQDQDGVKDTADNCPAIPNNDQKDTDSDKIGDACDTDLDGDGVPNDKDNCAFLANTDQKDSDLNGKGDVCDLLDDKDQDGIPDATDNCPKNGNPTQADVDKDGKGDACDDDIDGDKRLNSFDNCPYIANAAQKDTDGDGKGDACDDEQICGGGKPACPPGQQCYEPLCLNPTKCASQNDCKIGTFCYNGECVPPQVVPSDFCTSDTNCPAGFVCQLSKCSPDSCKYNSDCASGEKCLLGECLPNIIPTQGCQTDNECATNQSCVAGLCIPSQCKVDVDCKGKNEQCFKGFCIPGNIPALQCTVDEDCPFLPIGGLGDLQCAGGVCIPSIPGIPDLCNGQTGCKAGFQCLIAVCVKQDCVTSADCKPDQSCTLGKCLAKNTPIPSPGQCQSDKDCGSGQQCLATVCLPDLGLPGGGGGGTLPGGIELCAGGQKCTGGKKCQFGLICL